MKLSRAVEALEEATRGRGRWLRWKPLVGFGRFVILFAWEAKEQPDGYTVTPLRPIPDPLERTDQLDAIDDLWSAIDKSQIEILQPETVVVAHAVHDHLWHGEPL